jgi:Domain of unknown function (DUF4352)
MLKRTLAAFIGVALVVGLVGCGSLAPSKLLKLGGSSANPGQHKVGDKVDVDKVQFQIDGVSALPITTYDKPQQKGDMFVAVDLTITNNGSAKRTIGNLLVRLSLKDGAGHLANPTIYSTQNPPPAEELAAGKKTIGPVVFTIPKTAKNLQLTYDASPLGAAPVTWSLGDASQIK